MSSLLIVPFEPRYTAAFVSLNQAWIEQLFRMEESDRAMLAEPERYIIAKGGQIFIALDGDTPVGAVAAVRESASVFELAKMAVAPTHRGRGVGELLGRAAVAHARAEGASLMFLDTNSRLDNAIRLYERLGFRHATRPHASAYERSDVYMELPLDAGQPPDRS